MKALDNLIEKLEKFSGRPFYPLILLVAAVVDGFLFFIPLDVMLITSILARPKRWMIMSLALCLGTILATMGLALAVRVYGVEVLGHFWPHYESAKAWRRAVHMVEHYGDYAIFLTTFSIVVQLPTVVLSVLAKISFLKLLFLLTIGRIPRYLLLGGLAGKSPRLLRKILGNKAVVPPPEQL